MNILNFILLLCLIFTPHLILECFRRFIVKNFARLKIIESKKIKTQKFYPKTYNGKELRCYYGDGFSSSYGIVNKSKLILFNEENKSRWSIRLYYYDEEDVPFFDDDDGIGIKECFKTDNITEKNNIVYICIK